jgi:pyrimidine operon attenuation protein / uracil phosphoribosyltransferase
MKVVLDSGQINASIAKLTDSIASLAGSNADIAIIGIRSRGEVLGQRLTKNLSKKLNADIPCGTLDITLYRDDINDPQGDQQPAVRSTEIPFDISGMTIILVDDVLYTGRSVRAAMDALMSFGRPKAVKLAVLIDRGHRELPIQADFAAETIDIAPEKSVQVRLVETDGSDQVIVE